MIRVTKPPCPDALRAGAERTRADCVKYDENAAAYSSGERRFEPDRAIYGNETVKKTLQKAQHRKCCYCEARFGANAAADVEHYRPKGAVRQDRESRRLFPGYYWLAYSWENLYWCCQVCNRSCKKDLFPLEDPAARARSHRDDVSGEEPLLLDPGGPDDPRKHIKFRQWRAVSATTAGKKTIDVLGLNRPELTEARRERLDRLKHLQLLLRWRDVAQGFTGNMEPDDVALQERARRELDRAALPSEIFSAMAADLLLENHAGAEAP